MRNMHVIVDGEMQIFRMEKPFYSYGYALHTRNKLRNDGLCQKLEMAMSYATTKFGRCSRYV